MAFVWGQFRKRYLSHHTLKLAWKSPKIELKSPRVQWVKLAGTHVIMTWCLEACIVKVIMMCLGACLIVTWYNCMFWSTYDYNLNHHYAFKSTFNYDLRLHIKYLISRYHPLYIEKNSQEIGWLTAMILLWWLISDWISEINFYHLYVQSPRRKYDS